MDEDLIKCDPEIVAGQKENAETFDEHGNITAVA